VVGDSEKVLSLCSGGFRLDTEFDPSRVYELAKMDGAIVLSSDLKRIVYANTQLIPDPSIPTSETGTRHRTAQRMAKQTGNLVIAISQKRNIVTLYKDNLKYVMHDIGVVLAKANQALQTLENYKGVLNRVLSNLSVLEFEDAVSLFEVVVVIQRMEMVRRVAEEIERYICELGNEGRLVKMQLEELMVDVEDEGLYVINDYMVEAKDRTAESINAEISDWTPEDLLDLAVIGRALGHAGSMNTLDIPVSPRGYRILSKIPRLPYAVIENLVGRFGNLQAILNATIEELDEVEGIGEVRARAIMEGLSRLRQQLLLDRQI
jgi:diadenylate cyclase